MSEDAGESAGGGGAGGRGGRIPFSCGDGCNGGGDFDVTFSDACALAILQERAAECTGNRIVVAGKVVLTRP